MPTTYTIQQVQQNLLNTMNWGVAHHTGFTYSEGKNRMTAVRKPFVLPITSDCSSWVTSLCFWNGLNDPNGLKFNGQGYTGTLLDHLPHIDKKQVRVGDLVVYGAGTGDHVAMVANVDANGNILTCSMGQNGDPSWCWVNKPVKPNAQFAHITAVDGRTPQTFLRTDLTVVGTVHVAPAA